MAKTLKILGKRGRVTIPFEIRQRAAFACLTGAKCGRQFLIRT